MINKNKTIIRGVLTVSYILMVSIVLFLVSSLYSYLNTGADRSKMLHTEVKKIDQYLPKIIWANNGNEGREINEQTLKNIENDYLDAWYVKHIANKTNSKNGISDYYTDKARKNLFNFIAFNKEANISIESTTLAHNTDILFFSEDGQLVVLEDKNVIEYKKLKKNNAVLFETTEMATYKIVLLLEDGFWRIRHLVKESATEFDKTVHSIPLDSMNIKGINYYPQATPWNMFGDDFKINIIENDFKILAKAGLNTIRIFIPYEDFGKAKIRETKLNKLKEILDLAEQNNLKVVVTLFDFYGNYNVLDWTLTHRHAESIVSTFKNHNAILAWDIKNEPNLDFDSRKKENIISWLEHLLVLIKSIDKNHLVTIGWSNVESAEILKDKVDFVSFHYYENVDDFQKSYDLLTSTITTKPIVLGEFGVSSYSGIWNPFGGSEEKQAIYYKKMQKILTKNKIPFMSWTLYDFEKIPNEVLGILPWRKYPQKKFGFISNTGKKKLAFEFISK
jgi:hypothetical protein